MTTDTPPSQPGLRRSALAEPTATPPGRWVAFVTLASIGLWAGFFGPIQVLLAQQAEAISADDKKLILAVVTGLGAFVSVVCNPVFGAFSDRTTLRAGRRLPWVVAGAVGGALSLLLLAVADNVVVMALGWSGVQAALNAMLAAVTATVPLLYYMRDVLGFDKDEAADRVFLLTAIYAVVIMGTAVTFGTWSDRTGKRKVFVIWSGLVGATASLLLAFGQSWPAAVLAAILMGIGYGIYTAVDFALITQVLPGADARAKDLGVINIANALPQVFAPGIAAIILLVVEAAGGVTETNGDGFSTGYCVLYGGATLVAILGSVFVTRIKSVP